MPCGTVLEAAKDQGFKTGLVVTSRITHVCVPRGPKMDRIIRLESNKELTDYTRLPRLHMLPTSGTEMRRLRLPSRRLDTPTPSDPRLISLWVVGVASSCLNPLREVAERTISMP